MPRSVNAVASRQKRKKVLKETKGYFGRRKNLKTLVHAFIKLREGNENLGVKLVLAGFRSPSDYDNEYEIIANPSLLRPPIA